MHDQQRTAAAQQKKIYLKQEKIAASLCMLIRHVIGEDVVIPGEEVSGPGAVAEGDEQDSDLSDWDKATHKQRLVQLGLPAADMQAVESALEDPATKKYLTRELRKRKPQLADAPLFALSMLATEELLDAATWPPKK